MKKKLPIDVRPIDSARSRVAVNIPVQILDDDPVLLMQSTDHFAVLHSSITPPRRKLLAARWLLAQLVEHKANEAAALLFLESLVSMVRSATFALQKMGAGTKGFDVWYETRQHEMRADPHLRWLVGLRNAAEKEGLVLAEYGPQALVRFHRNGECTAEAGEPVFVIDGFESVNLIPDLENGIDKISAIIEQAHAQFFQDFGGKNVSCRIEYLREIEDGSWEHFDPDDMSAACSGSPRPV